MTHTMTEHTTFNKGDHVEYLGCFTEGRPGVLLTSAPDDAPETTVLVNWDNGGQESVKIGALRNVTPAANSDGDQVSTGISLPCSLGRDQEAREGLQRELWVADIDDTTEPRRVAIDYTEDLGGGTIDTRELGWFDVRTMVRQLAEFAPDLVVVRREDLPEVTITEKLDQERRDHEETRRELRAMTVHARKWQRFAAVIELMEDANRAELIIDGVRITPVARVQTEATKE